MKKELLENLYKKYKNINTENPYYINGSTQFVCGAGNYESSIMFIGEAPGKEENITGIPFQGRSGKLLRLHLKQNNFTDENSFITNIVKFRPPKNRKPTKKEILIHSQILKEELKIIKPKIIVPIGLTACVFILESSNIKITQIRGTIIKKNNLIIFPLLHPAYILRNRNIENIFENDIAKLYNCFLNYLK